MASGAESVPLSAPPAARPADTPNSSAVPTQVYHSATRPAGATRTTSMFCVARTVAMGVDASAASR